MRSSRRNDRVCHACKRVQSARNRLCSGCGETLGAATSGSAATRLPAAWRAALEAAPSASRARIVAQGALLMMMVWASWGYLWQGIDRSQRALSLPHHLLESANLVFHEAGHWIFGALGFDLLTIAGGSLMQVLIPAICAGAFLTRHPDPFAAAFAAWWTGQAAVDLAPYIADARTQQLILLGGVTGRDRPGYHDWNNLLGRLGLLEWDGALAALTHWGGFAVMVAAIVIALAVVSAQWRKSTADRVAVEVVGLERRRTT